MAAFGGLLQGWLHTMVIGSRRPVYVMLCNEVLAGIWEVFEKTSCWPKPLDRFKLADCPVDC